MSGDEFYDDDVTSGPILHVTAIGPAPADFWMPDIPTYLALAEAMHDDSDLCNANYVIRFAECGTRDADIGDAIRILVALHKDGWRLARDPGATVEMGL
jgi:hypothetical protein